MTARRRFGVRSWLSGGLLAFSLAAPLFRPTYAQEVLPDLARVGPWPVASEPIAFRGRVWFANSVKGRNHNSADLYSYDPATGALRYERHLFSQDAGQPLVADENRFNACLDGAGSIAGYSIFAGSFVAEAKSPRQTRAPRARLRVTCSPK